MADRAQIDKFVAQKKFEELYNAMFKHDSRGPGQLDDFLFELDEQIVLHTKMADHLQQALKCLLSGRMQRNFDTYFGMQVVPTYSLEALGKHPSYEQMGYYLPDATLCQKQAHYEQSIKEKIEIIEIITSIKHSLAQAGQQIDELMQTMQNLEATYEAKSSPVLTPTLTPIPTPVIQSRRSSIDTASADKKLKPASRSPEGTVGEIPNQGLPRSRHLRTATPSSLSPPRSRHTSLEMTLQEELKVIAETAAQASLDRPSLYKR